ncbi:hypothetical protein E2C01_082494 [Portunus trituberculatus]|uniref:Uncharacterized protein n=1 Tax=Portunus trituberculatus TaxID=210409 RepID=A0A5B7J539_PORTR|nr:hypothetical protein [Portunus trituberculatus]
MAAGEREWAKRGARVREREDTGCWVAGSLTHQTHAAEGPPGQPRRHADPHTSSSLGRRASRPRHARLSQDAIFTPSASQRPCCDHQLFFSASQIHFTLNLYFSQGGTVGP